MDVVKRIKVSGTLPLTNESNYTYETVILDDLPLRITNLLNSEYDNVKLFSWDWQELDVTSVSSLPEYNCDGFLAVKVPKGKITCSLLLILEIYDKQYHLTNNNVGKIWKANQQQNIFSTGQFTTDSTGYVLNGNTLTTKNSLDYKNGCIVIRASRDNTWGIMNYISNNTYYGLDYYRKQLTSGFYNEYTKDKTLKTNWIDNNIFFQHSKQEYNSNTIYQLSYSDKATKRETHKVYIHEKNTGDEYLHLTGSWKIKEIYGFNQPLQSQGEHCRLTYTNYDAGISEKVYCKMQTSLTLKHTNELKNKLQQDNKTGHFFWLNWNDYPYRDIHKNDCRNMKIYIDNVEIPHYTWAQSSVISLVYVPLNLINTTINFKAIVYGAQLICEVNNVFNNLIDTDAGRTPEEYKSNNTLFPPKFYNGITIGANNYYIDSTRNRIQNGWNQLDSFISGNKCYQEINPQHNELFLLWNSKEDSTHGTPLLWNKSINTKDGLGFSTTGKLVYNRKKLSNKKYTTSKTSKNNIRRPIATRFYIDSPTNTIRVVNDFLSNNITDDTYNVEGIEKGSYFTYDDSYIYSYFTFVNDYYKITGEDPKQSEVLGTGVNDITILIGDKQITEIYKGDTLLFKKSNFDTICVDRVLWDYLSEVN